MKLNITSAFLLTSLALLTSSHPLSPPNERNPSSSPSLSLRSPDDGSTTTNATSSPLALDFSNWAGAGIFSPPEGSGTFSKVTAQMTIPSFKRPANAPTNNKQEYGAFYWVGIGTSSVLQTGIWTLITKSGEHQIFAWYEWFPQGSVVYPQDLSLAVGDNVEMTVETAGPGSQGTLTVRNLNKGKTASKVLDPPGNADPGDKTAEWIVEEYVVGGEGTVPFVDFGTVSMTGCKAVTSKGGKIYGPQDGQAVDLKRGGKIAATGSVPGAGKVRVDYVSSSGV